ncbi:MAG TPA: acyl-CoA dehydrogenase family protein [Humidesulfovibrio sp.]|uniref:acyl-CoA dehydrogenase family protein n=1 Tax=Humidesulfovibrio sp. TaxID=2910988 RepID=UPI002D0ABEE3|nr:acyl-CoA dehydrogenase family protein [Humidesulfovibrio sp.]HWR05101.1 acyl-CoA dehydrogenase family protein [Humidesulfovibrio sp.]
MSKLATLPGDDVRQIMWRYTDRYDLQMVVQSARGVARGHVARMVADGARNTHEWDERKDTLLDAFDASGLTALYMDTTQGGYIDGPKNFALSLTTFELSWVDAGAATCGLATNLALAPIHEKGTTEQRDHYMGLACPAEGRKTMRGAFALTEPLPFVGVDTGILTSKIRVAEWADGQEPLLQVDKRGRFITGMDFANFVTAAVVSDDPRIKGSCMVILEEGDPGTFDRGAVTKKMVHQLSSTCDPIMSLKVPASRIIGGYTVKDGVIVPNHSHAEIIGSVFHRTRIPVGVMSSAKLLSAIEPIIRYHRTRFRGGDAQPGTPRFDQGLQMKEDACQRLADLWAVGEAGSSLGFDASRKADLLDPLEKEKEARFHEQGITGPRAQMSALKKMEPQVLEYLDLLYTPEDKRDAARFAELEADIFVQCIVLDAETNVLIPACKLWCPGVGANMMREAVSLVGGYGVTEDCPGFLFQKWSDCQLEATYEGPEVVQRRHLTATMGNPVFLALMGHWIKELDSMAATWPQAGTKALAQAMRLWMWTLNHLQNAKDAEGKKLFSGNRQGVTFPMADAISWLVAARSFVDDVRELKVKGPENPLLAESLDDTVGFFADLATMMNARAAGEVARVCAELVYGYTSAPEAGEFPALRAAVDASLAGARLARDRAGEAITGVMIPEALDYPL